ncbi:MAG: hypothetical protein GWN61_07410, partial [candidate division Zixibacteria bacterium]|nr:hypothetical protein [candidate division Zixibacteria bacterium]NIW44777.1 hypothetical protein [Gammaproteobacteria bacterium]NIW97435.1 hypothetical protein [Phycisphaerae bacterium]NIR63898.1 hypothetical protein [candidate division Zixibacteria bacterium]NIS45830.1 hypothetical protein [candidate division Zixibacteria bacterium]
HMGRYRQSALRDYLFGTLNQLLDLTTKYSPELILITGDIFRSKHPSVAALTQTGTLLAQVAQVAPVVLIAGNHDITSSTVTTIDVYSNYPNITVVTKPRILTYDRFQICAVPWLPQKALIAMGDGTESTAGAINFLMQLLTNQMDEDKFSILLAHATALGTDYHDGASSTLGSDVLWPNDWFREFDVCFLGHIHKPQTVPGTTNAFYVGSPCPISFNEAGQRKSVILYDDGAVTRIPTRHPHFASVRADELSGETDYSNTFLRITKKHGDPDPDVPDCL